MDTYGTILQTTFNLIIIPKECKATLELKISQKC